MDRLGVDEQLAERRGALVDRLAQGFEQARVAVLGRELHQLLEAFHDVQGIVADVAQLLPEPVDPRLLGVVEHQPGEVLVLAVEERDRDDLVGGDHAAVADRRREDLAELVECGLDALPGAAPFVDDDGEAGRER